MTTPVEVDYIRVKLMQCEADDRLKSDELFDPYVVVNVLEAQTEPGDLADFERDPRSSDSLRGSRNFVVF